MTPEERGALDLFRIMKSKPYTGPGERTGTPGNYKYTYGDKKGPKGKVADDTALEAVNGEELWQELLAMGFKAKLDHLPERTDKAHQNEAGEYTEERSALHKEWADSFLSQGEPVPMHLKPTAVIMMGGPGSGKSSTTQGMDFNNFVSVDPDAVKSKIPEYQEGTNSNEDGSERAPGGDRALNAAFMAHDESSDVAGMVRDQAITDRKNVLLDGTGKNLEKMQAQVKRLAKEGYNIKLVMPHIDVNEGKRRAAHRAKSSGRWVPMEVLDEAYGKIPTNFHIVSAMDEIGEARLFDNMGTQEEGARLMFSKGMDGDPPGPQVHNPELYQSYQGYVKQ
jgi:predicted ABC-type ATPase